MYIKALEIDNFKSFANGISIPFLQGFTTVSGPNGSGKSNIIDSILFALGFSSSRTLRVEKLSDYLSLHNPRKTEATVKVVLGVGEDEQTTLSVTRKIKKSSQGYNSVYYLNDKVSTLSDIHYELEKYNITPNSYNVVMQNEVMNITNCSNNDRRKIIEEIAGTAEFDRQIEKALGELEVVEKRVESTTTLLEELTKTIERLAEEREVAVKYDNLRTEKAKLESQVSAVTFCDFKKSLERVHESILEAGKKKKEKEFDLKKITEAITEIKQKLNIVNEKVKANGEDEQLNIIKQSEEIKGKIARKEDSIKQADNTIFKNNRQVIVGCENGIKNAENIITQSNNSINNFDNEIKGLEIAIKADNEELAKVLEEVTGLNQTAEQFIAKRTEYQKELDGYRVKDLEIEKKINPLELELKNIKDSLNKAEKLKEHLENSKKDFAGNKDKLELQIQELEKELQDYKTVQNNSCIELSDINSAISDKSREIDLANKKLTTLQIQKDFGESVSDRANDTVLKAHIAGVHNSLMNLATVDDEYATALETAMGARMRNIVVDDPDTAKICIELLKTNRAGTTTFLPLNKIKPAPNALKLPGEKGIVEFAINLIDFDDIYLDAFFLALGETLVVQDYETAKKLQGKYRMVTLSGELFDKSGAITGGDRKSKEGYKFSSSSEDELKKYKTLLSKLEIEYNNLLNDKRDIENRQVKIRLDYTEAANTLNSAKSELSTLLRNENESDANIQQCLMQIEKSKPEITSIEKTLDELEISKVENNEKILELQDKIAEIESKMNASDLSKLNSMTKDIETRIKSKESKISSKNNEIAQLNNNISFQKMIIEDNKKRISDTKLQNEELEKDKIRFEEDIKLLKEDLLVLEEKIAELTEKLKQFQDERDFIQGELLSNEKTKNIVETDLARIDEQIEAFKTRRRELEPKLKALTKELTDLGLDCSKITAPEMTTEEINSKIQKLQKKMTDLEPVNMNAIKDYDIQMSRKEEYDSKIEVLTNERLQIQNRMSEYGEDKKTAFLKTYNEIKENYKTIFEQLADGEGTLILENEEDPFAGGLTMSVKPRNKETKKLTSLSGGEKALAALALVFAIQKYLPAPFYALDEVDSSLDTINVEKLASIIKEQSKNTQFIVVSHRKPMIESANRTVGVTQKEKGITKVTGVKLRDE